MLITIKIATKYLLDVFRTGLLITNITGFYLKNNFYLHTQKKTLFKIIYTKYVHWPVRVFELHSCAFDFFTSRWRSEFEFVRCVRSRACGQTAVQVDGRRLYDNTSGGQFNE